MKAKECPPVVVTLLSRARCEGEPLLLRHFLLQVLPVGSAVQTCSDNSAPFEPEHVNTEAHAE